MNLYEILFISIGLAMDAFAAAICKGVAMKKLCLKKAMVVAIYLGLFQLMMPLAGYLLGFKFNKSLKLFDHWIALILLSAIGINMIKNSFSGEKHINNDSVDVKSMCVLALATSIDALAIGVTFSFLHVNILLSSAVIGIVTWGLSFLGVIIGNKVGYMLNEKSELLGGVILILIGIKIVIEHITV